jgi:NAD(P)-dependent dehydrogenase (short-subunit alcohol dehydrogenase family)
MSSAFRRSFARIDQADRSHHVSPREHVCERATQFAGADDGDVMHAWGIVMAAMDNPLRNQVAIITRGSRGIGLAIARALVTEGANVAITGRTEADLSEARRHIEAAGPGKVETFHADVRQYADMDHVVSATVARFGGLDILVNNAGAWRSASVADMTPEEWSAVIDTNLTGPYNACHAALPQLKKRGGGYIINISSLAGKNAFPNAAAYCASKSGLNAFSEVLMQEVRHDNIRVTYVMPGSVATGLFLRRRSGPGRRLEVVG